MNDAIGGKIIQVGKMTTAKMIALLTLILQCVHIKNNVFTLQQDEYFLYTMSLWYVIVTLKLSCKDIPG